VSRAPANPLKGYGHTEQLPRPFQKREEPGCLLLPPKQSVPPRWGRWPRSPVALASISRPENTRAIVEPQIIGGSTGPAPARRCTLHQEQDAQTWQMHPRVSGGLVLFLEERLPLQSVPAWEARDTYGNLKSQERTQLSWAPAPSYSTGCFMHKQATSGRESPLSGNVTPNRRHTRTVSKA
jgi:hypothetical protein